MATNVLLIYHDADLVTRMTFASLATDSRFEVQLARGSGDRESTHGMACATIPDIKSKFNFAAIRALRKVIVDNKIDVVFCASTSALSNALFATLGTKTKVVGYRGTQARVHPFDPTYKMALLNPRVAHIVCETSDIEEYLRKYIPARKLSTHPKPYRVEWVKDTVADPVKAKVAPGVLTLSYVGISKGRPHKGLAYLIDAVERLNERRVPVHLTVVGDADEEEIKRAPENVTFTGNRPDAIRYIAGSQLFVLPSTRDASPRVVREAQACAVPCVVTDIPGARDLIVRGENPSGVLVPPANPRAIADAVVDFVKNPEKLKAMGVSAKANIRDNYRFDRYVDYFAETLLGVCKK